MAPACEPNARRSIRLDIRGLDHLAPFLTASNGETHARILRHLLVSDATITKPARPLAERSSPYYSYWVIPSRIPHPASLPPIPPPFGGSSERDGANGTLLPRGVSR